MTEKMTERNYSFDETDVQDQLAQEVWKDEARVRGLIKFVKIKHNETSGDFRLQLGINVIDPYEDVALTIDGKKVYDTIWKTFGVPIRNSDFDTEDSKHVPSKWTKDTWATFCNGVLSDKGHRPNPIPKSGVDVFTGKEMSMHEASKLVVDLAKMRLKEAVTCLETEGAEYKDIAFFFTIRHNPADNGTLYYELKDMSLENDDEEFPLTIPEDLRVQYNPYGDGDEEEEEEEAPKKKKARRNKKK